MQALASVEIGEIENLPISFKGFPVYAITGLSGSGKSSLLYLLGLLDKPSTGKIFIDDIEVTDAEEKILQQLRLEKKGILTIFDGEIDNGQKTGI